MKCRVAEVVSVDGVPVRYEVRGSGEPTLVLVIGWGGNRTFWRPHSETLAAAHRVVAVDLPGFGESGSGRSAWTMQAYGHDVSTVVGHVGARRAVLVGQSMAGAAVLEAAFLNPANVAGVVLVDIFHDPDEKDADPSGEGYVDGFRSLLGGPVKDPAEVRSAMFSPDTPESLILQAISYFPHPIPEHWWEIVRAFVRWKNSRLASVLAQLEVPLEAINRASLQTKVEAFRRYMPSFRVATMDGVGHMGIVWERVEEFDRLLLGAVKRFSQRAGI
jgi:pimeloyl-ACP methyl ester carboxylesterase